MSLFRKERKEPNQKKIDVILVEINNRPNLPSPYHIINYHPSLNVVPLTCAALYVVIFHPRRKEKRKKNLIFYFKESKKEGEKGYFPSLTNRLFICFA